MGDNKLSLFIHIHIHVHKAKAKVGVSYFDKGRKSFDLTLLSTIMYGIL